jgi:uncharacterized cysteine cluster protein YcgN (CxxCxxCC family)
MAQKTRKLRKSRSSAKQRALEDALTVVRDHRNGSAAKAKKSQKQLEINRINKWLKENLPPQGTPEWEALCTQCGKCCYDKVWRGSRLMLLKSACAFLDTETNLCKCYEDRFANEPLCMPVGAEIIQMGGLPGDCPYVENLPGYRPPLVVDKTIDEF